MVKPTPIKPPSLSVEPPEGWQQETAFGFMRYAPGPLGQLVRLADVARWLMRSQELPRVEALTIICDALEAASPAPNIYFCQTGKYAELVPENYAFELHTKESLQKAKDEAIQVANQTEFEGDWLDDSSTDRLYGYESRKTQYEWPEPVLPGLPAAIKRMQLDWVESQLDDARVFDERNSPLSALSLRVVDVATLWRYGVLVSADIPAITTSQPAPSEPLKQPKVLVKDSAPDWSGKRLHEKQQELKKSGVQNFTVQLCEVSGLEATEVRRRIKAYKDSLSSSMGSMVSALGSVRPLSKKTTSRGG